MEAARLIEDKLNQYRHKTELKQTWSPELHEQLIQSYPDPKVTDELQELMKKDAKEILQDATTLQQLANGDCDLHTYSEWQFIQNEEVVGEDIEAEGFPSHEKIYRLEHFPAMKGSVTGTAYDGNVAIQTFVVQESGQFNWADIGHPKRRVAIAQIDHELGEIEVNWSHFIGSENKIVFSYEYNYAEDGRLPSESQQGDPQ